MNISALMRIISSELADITEDAALEARLLIQKVTGLSRPVLLSHPEREILSSELSQIQKLTEQRKTGVPLPYLLGEWEFYGRSFFVDPSVLIPRPETELLVEEAVGWLKKHPTVNSGFDIGTGSGCIAVSLLLENPNLHMKAIDLHRNALLTAVRNANRHRVMDRFFPVQCNLYSAFSDKTSLVCANLPYIPTSTCHKIAPARFEPLSALDGGEDGFELYRLLFTQLRHKINRECLILCEIEYRQQDLALETAAEHFPGCIIKVMKDLAGLPRILRIESI